MFRWMRASAARSDAGATMRSREMPGTSEPESPVVATRARGSFSSRVAASARTALAQRRAVTRSPADRWLEVRHDRWRLMDRHPGAGQHPKHMAASPETCDIIVEILVRAIGEDQRSCKGISDVGYRSHAESR